MRNMNGGPMWEVSGLLGVRLYWGPAFLRQALTPGGVCTWSTSWRSALSKAWSSAVLFLETLRVGVLLEEVVTESIFQAESGHLALSSSCHPPSSPSPSFQLSTFVFLLFCVSVSLSLLGGFLATMMSCTILPVLPGRLNFLKLRAWLNLVPFRVFLLGILS